MKINTLVANILENIQIDYNIVGKIIFLNQIKRLKIKIIEDFSIFRI